MLFATPEYNGSIPGQLKNALDWVSRQALGAPFRGTPVAVIGASPGQFGGVWAQRELRKVLGVMGARVVPDRAPRRQGRTSASTSPTTRCATQLRALVDDLLAAAESAADRRVGRRGAAARSRGARRGLDASGRVDATPETGLRCEPIHSQACA